MERQNRMITVLSVLFLGLVAFLLVVKDEDSSAGSDKDDKEVPTKDLFDYEEEQITKISLQSAAGTVRLEKKDGDWRMVEPRDMPVEARRVDEIVERLDTLRVEERELTGALSEYGLEESTRSTVTLSKDDGTSFSLIVGRDAPVGYKTYVLTAADGKPRAVSTRIADVVKRGADDFRSKDLWSISSGTARRIRIEQGGAAVVLRQDDHGWWLGDAGPRADDEAISDWLSDASFLRIASFLDGQDPAALGLTVPSASITIEDQGGNHVLNFGQRSDDGVVVNGPEGPVMLGKTALELLKMDGWLSKKLMPVRRPTIDGIEVELGGKTARFTLAEGAWLDATGKNTDAVDGLLSKLDEITVDRAVTGLAIPAQTWGRITLSEGETRKETVVIGEAVATGRVARDLAGGPPFAITQADLDALSALLTPQ